MALNPNYTEAHRTLGSVLPAVGAPGEAIGEMRKAIKGDLDKALVLLERAYQARSSGLIYLHLDPGYEPLRQDPRFTELVGRIGLR